MSSQVPVVVNDFPKEYMDHDIIGLSCISASNQYIVKFLTLRQHLELPTHPIVKLIDLFRKSLEGFFKDSINKIKQGVTMYDRQFKQDYYRKEYEKLLDKIISEIKNFVKIMHNVVVMFYRLEVKVAYDTNESECLSNLLTSLVVQNPIYSQIHELIYFKHKYEIRAIKKTIETLNKEQNLDVALNVDRLKLGKQILENNQENNAKKQQNSDEHDHGSMCDCTSMEVNDEDQQALDAFDMTLKQFERLRHVSSPILKIIILARAMDKLLGVMTQAGEVQEADVALQMMFYCLSKIKGDDHQHLGAKFMIQCTYANLLMHEDQLGVISDYLYISHAESVLGVMKEGPKACLRKFISLNDFSTPEGNAELKRSISEFDKSASAPKTSREFLNPDDIARSTTHGSMYDSYKKKKAYTNSILEKIHREGISRMTNSTLERSQQMTPQKNQLSIGLTKSTSYTQMDSKTGNESIKSVRKNPLMINTVEKGSIIVEEVNSQYSSSNANSPDRSLKMNRLIKSDHNTEKPFLDMKLLQPVMIEETNEADLEKGAETMRSMRETNRFEYMNNNLGNHNASLSGSNKKKLSDSSNNAHFSSSAMMVSDLGSSIIQSNTDLVMTTTDELRIQMQPKIWQMKKSLINGLDTDASPRNPELSFTPENNNKKIVSLAFTQMGQQQKV